MSSSTTSFRILDWWEQRKMRIVPKKLCLISKSIHWSKTRISKATVFNQSNILQMTFLLENNASKGLAEFSHDNGDIFFTDKVICCVELCLVPTLVSDLLKIFHHWIMPLLNEHLMKAHRMFLFLFFEDSLISIVVQRHSQLLDLLLLNSVTTRH
jgi:hypothetical protein